MAIKRFPLSGKKPPAFRDGMFVVIVLIVVSGIFMIPQTALTAPGAPVPNPERSPDNEGSPENSSHITLNFTEADLRIVIDAVSKYTGLNFVVDPRVKGKVTIISQHPMNAEQVYQVFLSVLSVHGFSAIPGPAVIKIVPDVAAKQDAIDTISDFGKNLGDAMVTQVIEVKHVSASDLVPILRPLVPQYGHLAAVPNSNVIIISDLAANIARIAKIIHRIDTATGNDIDVIPLRHASAAELVRILSQLISKDSKNTKSKPVIVADERSNSLLISGDKSTRLNIRTMAMYLDTPSEIGGNIHVVYLRNAVAKGLVPILTAISQSELKTKSGTAASSQSGNVGIQADESTNALVITAPSEVFRSLKAIISQLDIRQEQVMVEAVIAEVSYDKSREFGIQWAMDGNNAVGLVNFDISTPITSYADLSSVSPVGFNVGLGNLTGSNRIAALISALAGDSQTNILSTPSLVTLDNKEAEIVVGQNVPFITGSYSTSSSSSTNAFNTITRQDVGLSLKVKPQINDGDTIKLDVTQEVSSVSNSSAASDIITNKRSIKTSVMVNNGQIIVLGGLIQDNLTNTEQKVPVLGDVPLLGWLFRYQKATKSKTDLMVFLCPTILKDRKTMAAITSGKYNDIRSNQSKMKAAGMRLTGNNDIPVLPDISEITKLPPPFEEWAH